MENIFIMYCYLIKICNYAFRGAKEIWIMAQYSFHNLKKH